ncbi:MAG: hypothetical protein FWE28_04860 [Oscillospiraceae bacterium]|nr:hypothetical protein [Oscillospiraceae bacterium]
MKEFESSFSDFIDGQEYDKAEDALFSLVRMAFKAGWQAAGGEVLEQGDTTTRYEEGKPIG